MRRLDRSTLPAHVGRLRALTADTSARWGGMDAARMVRHLRATVEMSLGEIDVPPFLPAILGKPLGLLIFYVVPILPRGKPGSTPPVPMLCPAAEHPFDEERARLLAALDRFVARLEANPRERTRHAVLGRTTMRTWSRIHEVHFRHHERQFGVL